MNILCVIKNKMKTAVCRVCIESYFNYKQKNCIDPLDLSWY